MAFLYNFAGVWMGGAAVVFLAAIALAPPRVGREWDDSLRVALGWPWFLGRAVVDILRGRHLDAGQ